ncbi:MAG: hypothetical protein K9K37_13030 [Desulfocapsa sp.]|nr:hypothetical protein [Desulfocapsa sp.]
MTTRCVKKQRRAEIICYCHNHTAADLEKDVLEHGRSTIMEQIIAESKAGKCDCKTLNPKGR